MGVLVYICSFIAGILIATLLGIDLDTAVEAPPSVWYIGIVATVIILGLFTHWYFKDKKIKPTPKEGFYFGLTAVIIGTIIDAVLIIPYIILSDAPQDIFAYYTNPLFLVTLLIVLATPTVIGWMKQKKR